jgi:hypothetical protein
MNRVLFETNYMNPSGFLSISVSICMVLLFYLCLRGLIEIDKRVRRRGKKIKVLKIFEKAILFFIIIFIVAVIEEYVGIVVQYKTGHYIEIEGVVENYSYTPGRKGTIFTIDDVEFQCPSSSWGYKPTNENSNKVIKENGQYLRIRYVSNEIYGNVIVYIEQLISEDDN